MTSQEINDLYLKSYDLVFPYLNLEGHEKLDHNNEQGKESLKQGIEGFNLLLEHSPKNWAALWILGKIYQVMGDHEKSYKALLRSHHNILSEQNVMRELALECLYTKRFSDAVYYLNTAIKFDSEDTTLWSNMAICQLFNNNLKEARNWANKTLDKIEDSVATKVLFFLQEIESNKRSIPTDFGILENEFNGNT